MPTINIRAPAAALALALILTPFPGHAHDGAFLELLEVLHENGTIDQRAYEMLREAARAGGNAEPRVAEHPARAEPERPELATTGKLQVSSPEGDFSHRIGGRLMWDSVWYGGGLERAGGEDATELRRARLYVSGRLWRLWEYKAQFDFAGAADGGDEFDEVEIKDLYLRYTGFGPARVSVGNVKVPFGLEALTSSKYVTFMERALPTEAFSIGRRVGVRYDAHWNAFTISGGLFSADEINNDHDDGYYLAGRLTWSPWHGDARALHLGAAVTYHDSGRAGTVRYRARPETHASIGRLVDTGELAAGDALLYGVEAAWVGGPFSVQAELMGTEPDGGGDPAFRGGYAQASWFLTGESRVYEFDDGGFGNVTPRAPLGRGGYGAWELAVRWSHLDLDDGADATRAGEQQNLAFALNWYPAKNIRFSANYVNVLDLDYRDPLSRDLDGDAFQVRAQWHY